MARHVFEVEITRTETATLLVVGESESEVEEAFRRDVDENKSSYDFGHELTTDVAAWELKLKPDNPKLKEVEWAVVGGEVCEIDEYQKKLETLPITDTVTLPLFAEKKTP